jgi:hypothetical protein
MPSAASPASVADVLAAIAAAMRRCRCGWYVFGAQAVLVYGRPRTTGDVDVTVTLGKVSIEMLIAALAREGIELRIPRFAELLAQARVLPLLHASSASASGSHDDDQGRGSQVERIQAKRASASAVRGKQP